MSLVVGRRGEKGIYIVSDTRITNQDEAKSGLLFGALKAVIINPSLCICYAGTVAIGLEAIRKLPTGLDISQVLEYFLENQQGNKGGTDYIIASLNPLTLNVIKNGTVSDSAAWIGDADAFGRYQTHFLAPADPNDEARYSIFPPEIRSGILIKSKMDASMSKVIDDMEIKSVGDFLIRIESSPSGFRYLESATGFNFKPVIGNTTEEQNLTLQSETTAGGFNYSILVPKESGKGAVGVYFSQGWFGALFYPQYPSSDPDNLKFDPPILYRGMDMNNFIIAVERDHGFSLTGIGLNLDGFSVSFAQ